MSDKERWCTPPEVFEPLMDEFGFDLDAAADTQTTRLERYIDPTVNALNGQVWHGDRIWLNPPYGRKLEPFVRRAFAEAQRGILVAALIPFRCRADWWHSCVLYKAPQVRCYRKRIKFLRPDGTPGDYTMTCDSCLVVWRGAWRGITTLISA